MESNGKQKYGKKWKAIKWQSVNCGEIWKVKEWKANGKKNL